MKIWTEISAERLIHNFSALQRIAEEACRVDGRSHPETPAPAVLAVVKANAYGHGIDPCAAILAAAGAEWLGVTDAREGIAVRDSLARGATAEDRQPSTLQPRILVMCGTAALPGEAVRMVRHQLTPVIWTRHQIASLAAAVKKAGCDLPFEVHLEIDTGMSRQGVRPGADLEDLLVAIVAEPLLVLDGVMTHFASTEVAHSSQTSAQQREFETALAQVAASGATPGWIHVGNSSYIDNGECSDSPLPWLQTIAARFSARAMVRSGIALYGYLLPTDAALSTSSLALPHLLPVLTWKTLILSVADVPAGAAIGYNGTYIAERPMRVALLAAGYADGLRRELSSTNARAGGWVMIHDQRAAIVGRVSMNLTSVDVTGISDATEGDEAILLGESVTADDHAALAGTIAYEILCGIRTSA